MMEYIRENFFLPGQIENWVVIADLEHMGLMSVPFKVLKFTLNSCYFIETEDLPGNLPKPIQMHLRQGFHCECVRDFSVLVVDSADLPGSAHQEEDPNHQAQHLRRAKSSGRTRPAAAEVWRTSS